MVKHIALFSAFAGAVASVEEEQQA